VAFALVAGRRSISGEGKDCVPGGVDEVEDKGDEGLLRIFGRRKTGLLVCG
jgi:hypothetical protein